MPHTIVWSTEMPDVLRVDVTGDVKWQEIYEVIDAVKAMTAEQDKPYHLLFVAHTKVPKENPIPHLRYMYNFIASEQRMKTMVNVDPTTGWFIEAIAQAIFRMNGVLKNVHITKSLEDGIKFIQNYESQQANPKI